MNAIEKTITHTSSSNSPPTLPPRWHRDIYAPTHVPFHLLPVSPSHKENAFANVDTQVYIHMQCIGLLPNTLPPLTLEEKNGITYLVLVFYWYQKHHSISETIVDVIRPNLEITLKFHKWVDMQLHTFFLGPSIKTFPSFLFELIQHASENYTPLLTSLFQRCSDQPLAIAQLEACPTSIPTSLPLYLFVQVYLQILKCLLEHTPSLSFTSSLEGELIASFISKDEAQACQSMAFMNMYIQTADVSWLSSALSCALPNPYLHLYIRWHVHVSGLSHEKCMDFAQRSHPQQLAIDVSDLLPPPMYTEMPSTMEGMSEFLKACTLHFKKLIPLNQFGFTKIWEQCIVLWVPSLDAAFENLGTFEFSAEWLGMVQEIVQFEADLNTFRVSVEQDAAKIDFNLTNKCLDTAFTWLLSQKTFLMNLVDRTLVVTLNDEIVDPSLALPFTESILTLFQACHSIFKAIKQIPIPLLRHHLLLTYISMLDSVVQYYFQSYKKFNTKALNALYALEQYIKLIQLVEKEVPFPFTFIGERTKCMLRELGSKQESKDRMVLTST